MPTIGKKFPSFELNAVVSADVQTAFQTVKSEDYKNRWLIAFFWPKDFTFICPTEIAEFGRLKEKFAQRDADIIGISTDSDFVHLAWRQAKEELRDLPFPMVSDIKRELSADLNILDEAEGVAQRATYIIDPQGIIRFFMINDLNVGRNPQEVLRVLDGLQTDELCPCNWQPGQDTLTAADPITQTETV